MFHKIALEFTELNKKVIPRILQWKRVIDITWESCMSFIHGYEVFSIYLRYLINQML